MHAHSTSEMQQRGQSGFYCWFVFVLVINRKTFLYFIKTVQALKSNHKAKVQVNLNGNNFDYCLFCFHVSMDNLEHTTMLTQKWRQIVKQSCSGHSAQIMQHPPPQCPKGSRNEHRACLLCLQIINDAQKKILFAPTCRHPD